MMTFQVYWWRKTSGTLPYIIAGTIGHLSREPFTFSKLKIFFPFFKNKF
jgi:hypothetical protein